jgi:CheY-like chemotaxis protein
MSFIHLVVDDNPINRTIIKIFLERMNQTVLECDDGEKAINIIKNRSDVNIIWLDYKMPIMDGIKCT